MNRLNNGTATSLENRSAAAAALSGVSDPRVLQAVEDYLAAAEAGRRPDRVAFLARHAAIADVLSGCLDGLELLQRGVPELQGPPSSPPADFPATPLGDFRLLREIGRGGMGIVYEAVQLSLGRRVALKVLPFAAALDAKQLQRFKNEAQAAAHLHHSNIVSVFAVGCERGVHYYAMQFIEGKTLAALIDELRQVGPQPAQSAEDIVTAIYPLPCATAPLPSSTAVAGATLATERSTRAPGFFRTVAQLGIQAADALEHAHQLGVVHRDIKPANLMVDGRGQLWVTDFGLARCQSEAGLTMTGDLLGTLRYMSPEQALAKRGLIDHRTDIYSLGATLYELLTLQPVFAGSDRQEMLRRIAFDEPLPPRRLNKAIPRELETIVLKALGKHPEERYGTAQEMADDLRRFLDDRPILARRPTLVDRAAKWSRRHRGVLGAAVALLVVAVVGLTVSTVLISQEQARTQAAYEREVLARAQEAAAYQREVEAHRKEAEARQQEAMARQQEAEARQQEAEARQQEAEARRKEAEARQRAEENFRQARAIVDYLWKLCAEDLKDKPELHALRKELLETALKYYQAFIAQCREDGELHAELVASSIQLADVLDKMGKKPDALVVLEQAKAQIERVATIRKATAADVQKLSVMMNQLNAAENTHLRLVAQKGIQEELKLSTNQRLKIAELLQGNRRYQDGRLPRGAEDEKKLEEILTPEQSKRLSQIALQQRGSQAFRDAEVIAALQLTAEQKEQVRSILDRPRRPLIVEVNGAQVTPVEAPKPPEPRKKTLDLLLGVLTDEQKAKWQELVGKPVEPGALGFGVYSTSESVPVQPGNRVLIGPAK
jgi:serine/threonine protein kinase